MLRTCVLCCAMAGVVALAVGCNLFSGDALKQRDEAVKTINAQLTELDKDIARLKEKAEKATGEEKAKLEAKWKESAGKREALGKKLEELKTAAADKWEAIKKDTDKAFDDLKKSVE